MIDVTPPPSRREELDIARLTHVRPVRYGRIAALIGIAVLTVALVRAFARGQIAWTVTFDYLFWPTILTGLFNTVWLSVLCMALGIAIGLGCALAHRSANPVLRWSAAGYIWFFRGAPLVLQLLIWYNLALVFPTIGIPGLFQAKTVVVITPLVAAILGFALNEGAYVAEIMRAGLNSVDHGQSEASQAIGMTRGMTMRRIVLPQAMRAVIPPLTNEFISLVKMTSLASIIGFGDLLRSVQDVYYGNARVIELLMVATVWYLAVVTVLTVGQRALERRFGRGFVTGARK